MFILRVLKGKTIVEAFDFDKIIEESEMVVVDIGTGNGRFVYKNAKNPTSFYIGIDLSLKIWWNTPQNP